ncbi:NADH-quinone oxidoreductase subunit K [Geomobilimonas luticola]|uniref:NADH-quinone oxidoreductase subunit K n=1 Tax=Geomobilimonas luticola TaxID=1114878 RepID=A0ABS5SBX5_9BACT|nr:NADH-quinone oxidoreductase subunit K [Geomobilimonas luticola]MBT0652019.1 NADH-quinone oxidoreductase subunit K [Geomobilimonas luticola]
MSSGLLFAAVGCLLLVLGVGGVLLLDHLVRRILAFNLMGSGIFLVLVGLAQRSGRIDPVPQAMVLTGIVVSVAATALALALARRRYADSGSTTLQDKARREDRHD